MPYCPVHLNRTGISSVSLVFQASTPSGMCPEHLTRIQGGHEDSKSWPVLWHQERPKAALPPIFPPYLWQFHHWAKQLLPSLWGAQQHPCTQESGLGWPWTVQGDPSTERLHSWTHRYFPLYPTDSWLHTEHSSNVFTKLADNMITAVGLISNEDETDYRSEMNHLATWCTDNNLGLNVAKTEIVVDFWRAHTQHAPLCVECEQYQVPGSPESHQGPLLDQQRLTAG